MHTWVSRLEHVNARTSTAMDAVIRVACRGNVSSVKRQYRRGGKWQLCMHALCKDESLILNA